MEIRAFSSMALHRPLRPCTPTSRFGNRRCDRFAIISQIIIATFGKYFFPCPPPIRRRARGTLRYTDLSSVLRCSGRVELASRGGAVACHESVAPGASLSRDVRHLGTMEF